MGKIKEVIAAFPQTEIWIDSFHREDHERAIAFGSVGVTTSPTWVSRMLLQERDSQASCIDALIATNPEDNVFELMWKWTLKMGAERSKMMLPLWKKGNCRQGRFSIQTSILEYRNQDRMLKMAQEINALGPNMQVKIPATKAGIKAMEEATYLGISVMATLCFSVDQAIAVGEAVERGLQRREQEKKAVDQIHPVCAVLLGMQEDWLKEYIEQQNMVIQPTAIPWAGVAICKKIAKVYQEKNYRVRILTAYYRHPLHYSQFFGGDIIMSIPYKWQKRFDESDVEVKNTMEEAVASDTMSELFKLPPFVSAYSEGALKQTEFDLFPPVALTIRYFTACYNDALAVLWERMVPNPLDT